MNVSLNYNGNKGFRLLSIYERLNKGELVNKDKLANNFGVTSKTIQRDIDDLRTYLSETHFMENEVAIKYDKIRKGYFLVRFEREWLTNEEALAVCKVLLESRAFSKFELNTLIEKFMSQVTQNDRKNVERIIKNEQQHYVPLKHGKNLIPTMWVLSDYIYKNECIIFSYTRKDGVKREHKVKPVALMFSEYYFYLISFMADNRKEWPTVFRIDRMQKIQGTKEYFTVPYKDKFEDGEFRKRVQFMYSGKLKKVTFEYSGQSIEAVLDRLPTSQILKEKDGVYTITVEVYGDGFFIWFRSQGDMVNLINIES